MSNISVIVPVYKVEPWLRRCVDSILAQTFTDFELILVDDGSPDNCGAICDEYAKKDSRVHVIHQQNGGLSAARNAGIDWAFANSDSHWLTFIDSDDFVSSEYLEKMFLAATQAHADLCISDFSSVFPDGTTENASLAIPDRTEIGRELLEEGILYNNWRIVPAWNKLYKKHLFAQIRFPVGYIHEDEAIIHRILILANKVVLISDPLYFYLQRSNSITGTGKTIKSTDYLYAFADRIRTAKNHGLAALQARSVRVYRSFLLYTALPLLLTVKSGDPHIKRSAKATRAVLKELLFCSDLSIRDKIRVALFCFLPKPYLSFSKHRVNRQGE